MQLLCCFLLCSLRRHRNNIHVLISNDAVACSFCQVGMWYEVEILLEEMQAFGIPLQESVMISVLNVCRTLLPLPKTSDPSTSFNTYETNDDSSDESVLPGMNDMRSKVTSCQWARTLWLIQNYGLKATNVTESMYTMGMDVCESGGR